MVSCWPQLEETLISCWQSGIGRMRRPSSEVKLSHRKCSVSHFLPTSLDNSLHPGQVISGKLWPLPLILTLTFDLNLDLWHWPWRSHRKCSESRSLLTSPGNSHHPVQGISGKWWPWPLFLTLTCGLDLGILSGSVPCHVLCWPRRATHIIRYRAYQVSGDLDP